MDNKEFINEEQFNPQDKPFDFGRIFKLLKENWLWIAASLLIAIVGALFVNRYSTPIYEVNSSLIVYEKQDIRYSSNDVLVGSEMQRSSSNMEKATVVLKTNSLIRESLVDLDLNVSYYAAGQLRNVELYKK